MWRVTLVFYGKLPTLHNQKPANKTINQNVLCHKTQSLHRSGDHTPNALGWRLLININHQVNYLNDWIKDPWSRLSDKTIQKYVVNGFPICYQAWSSFSKIFQDQYGVEVPEEFRSTGRIKVRLLEIPVTNERDGKGFFFRLFGWYCWYHCWSSIWNSERYVLL